MKLIKELIQRKKRRKLRTRSRIYGTAKKPRLSVFRSNRYIYGQLIDDEQGETLASVSSRELKVKSRKSLAASEVGKLLGEKAKKLGIKQAIFDRGAYQYHGRVKALAQGFGEVGIKI